MTIWTTWVDDKPAMKLADYMEKEGLDDAGMAERLGISQWHVIKLRLGTRNPSMKLARRILEVTGGRVTTDEWLFPDASGGPVAVASPCLR